MISKCYCEYRLQVPFGVTNQSCYSLWHTSSQLKRSLYGCSPTTLSSLLIVLFYLTTWSEVFLKVFIKRPKLTVLFRAARPIFGFYSTTWSGYLEKISIKRPVLSNSRSLERPSLIVCEDLRVALFSFINRWLKLKTRNLKRF